jgi:hypothetical protein
MYEMSDSDGESECGRECVSESSGCNSTPQIVKIGDNRDQAKYVKQNYLERMSAPILSRVNTLIKDMPNDGPIPLELKNIFYDIASNEPEYTDNSLLITGSGYGLLDLIFVPIIYGVRIDDLLIIRLSNKWGIFNTKLTYIKAFHQIYNGFDVVQSSTFCQPDYFTCDKPGKYYINDKVFDMQGRDDIVYKDRFLIRCDPSIVSGPNYNIVYPELTTEFAETRYFTFEMEGYSLNHSLTLISMNYFYYIAECANLGKNNVIKVYAESEEYYASNRGEIVDFYMELLLSINDVGATLVNSEDRTSDIKPGKIIKYNKHSFLNHYPHTVTKTSIIIYNDIPYILTEFGLIYEIIKNSGKHTKPAKVMTNEA